MTKTTMKMMSVIALLCASLVTQAQPQPTPGFGTYRYDGSGNITVLGNDAYIYDEFGRLHRVTVDGHVQEFIYDRYGNILNITTDGDTANPKRPGVDPATNWANLTHDPVTGEPNDLITRHDDAGNVEKAPGAEFEYDSLNIVKASIIDGVRRVHIYSAADERIATMTMAGTRPTAWTVRDPANRVLRRYSSDNSGSWRWEEDYIYAGAGFLAAEVPMAEKVRHFHTDHLGTPRLITGNGGAEVARHTYYPFGEELTPANDGEPRKFTGHERDSASLDYMHARYYQPVMGRFLAVDPDGVDLRRPQTWNRYTYVINNPVNLTDPTGRCLWDVCIGEGALLWAAGAALAATTTVWLNSASGSQPNRTNAEVISANITGAVTGTIGVITSLAEKKDDPPTEEAQGEGRTGGESKTVGQTKIGPKVVRVDVEKPQGGGVGNVHIQTKGKGGGDKWYIKDPKDLGNLPKAIRDSALIQQWVKKALELLEKYRQNETH